MQAVSETLQAQSMYSTEHSFSAAKYEETLWDRLLPGQAESYRYHLAFELARVQSIRTGYAAVRRGGIVVCLAPYFIQTYIRESAAHPWPAAMPAWLGDAAAERTRLSLLTVGSTVAESCTLAIAREYHFDPAMVVALYDELRKIGAREGVDAMAFKDVLQQDAEELAAPLRHLGFKESTHRRLAVNRLALASLDDYLATLEGATRQALQSRRAAQAGISIQEYSGIPPDADLQEVHRLHLASDCSSDGRLEKLTPHFFESVAALMPHHSRYVLYRVGSRLVGFNLLLHRDHVLIHKYSGVDPVASAEYGLPDLFWLHNIEMCIRDGFHTYKSGDFTQHKIALGAESEQTYLFSRVFA